MIARLEASARSLAHAALGRASRPFPVDLQLLPVAARDAAAVLYAYCQRASDAIAFAGESELPSELRALRAELDAIYAGSALGDPIASSFQHLIRARSIPRAYADELLAGLELDALTPGFASLPELLRHCYRAAGTVGLMLCHVLGVREDRALPHAAHLGIAIQLTNVCCDVADDFQHGRLYLPRDLLEREGAADLPEALGGALPRGAAPAVARVIAALLGVADAFYASADKGLRYLSSRCAFAVRAARLICADLAAQLRARRCDPFAPRPVVGDARRRLLIARAATVTLLELKGRAGGEAPAVPRSWIADPVALLDAGGTP